MRYPLSSLCFKKIHCGGWLKKKTYEKISKLSTTVCPTFPEAQQRITCPGLA